ncbi:unnamed protein product [Gongylonema pulchrum]|uniref:HTH La-type RNA-binding domain-containing protein n=1 Tax=Gongylonema pulchrum TaxID=637853 RepID=A0A183ELS2_9BILA|nr:unnamed protein product [Gongylonema pulchrum]
MPKPATESDDETVAVAAAESVEPKTGADAQQASNMGKAKVVKIAEQNAEDGQEPGSNGTISELQKKIIEQVEYYFGDINLPRDRFLQEELKKDSGWISLETMLKFNRLSRISSEIDVIAEALKHSKLMEVFEDGSKIRRNPEKPLPDNSLEYWQIVKLRTVYIKGFEQDTKLDEIMNFVKQYGKVENVMMRRLKTGTRAFKGSVFVTFRDQSAAEAFVKNENAQFNGNTLLKMMQ